MRYSYLNRHRTGPTALLVLASLAVSLALTACARGDDWPQWRGPNRDGVWRERRAASTSSPTRSSRSPGDSRSAAATAGRPWPRAACSSPIGSSSRSKSNACIASTRRPANRSGRTATTAPTTNVGYTAGPRAACTIDDGRAYALGSMGHLVLLRRRDRARCCGAKICNDEYKIRMPIWGIAASPLVDGTCVIVQIGGEEACLVAFDKKSRRGEVAGARRQRLVLARRSSIEQAGQPRAGLLDRRQRGRPRPPDGRSAIGSIRSSRPRW